MRKVDDPVDRVRQSIAKYDCRRFNITLMELTIGRSFKYGIRLCRHRTKLETLWEQILADVYGFDSGGNVL